MLYQNILDKIVDISKLTLGEQLTGVYLHGSMAMGCFNPDKSDMDLAAHFTIINHCGIILYGEEIASVFSAVPKMDYIDSIWSDIEEAREEILANPMYMILNLCRVAAYVKDDLVTSKKQGGEWGIQNLESQYQNLISKALACYASDEKMVVEDEEVQSFAEYMLGMIVAAKG